MSLVTIQVGQCGNQIGSQLFSTIADDMLMKNPGISASSNDNYIQQAQRTFFNTSIISGPTENQESLKARAVMVDMEPKVIAQVQEEAKMSKVWSYSERQQFCHKRGSGNNWAHGFCTHGPQAREIILNLVQSEVEKCDYFGGFLNIMSLAGGTGSGVGTYLTRTLRDEFPHSFILNQVVGPYNTGEVIVQNYNAVLSLAHLYSSSDAILCLENDVLHKICAQLLNIKNISFRDMNKVISHAVASILQPARSYENNYFIRNPLASIMEDLVSHPGYKLLSLRTIPMMSDHSVEFSTFQWYSLIKHLRQMLIANAQMEEGIDWQVQVNSMYNRCIGNLLVLRGKEIESANISSFRDKRLYSSWVPDSCALTIWKQQRQLRKYEKSATLLSNCQASAKALDNMVGKAWSMFSSRAYIHHYLRHGISEDDFVDCFAGLEQVIKNYKEI
ncbi:tubulin delta chain-like [Tubulanus polymorphus]|uniref:tubulin delta chain-like n=1 Tax=Tubulanus polymorphus TaxID=672921 RepID=UPI003DA30266